MAAPLEVCAACWPVLEVPTMTLPIKKGRWQATPKITDTCDSTPFGLRLKALLLWLALYDAAIVALLALIVWRALP